MSERAIESIKRHEGLRLEAYQDHLGHWTIGYGTNLEKLVIDQELAEKWLTEKVAGIRAQLQGVKGFLELDLVRREVLVEMSYQLGVAGCLQFERMWAALRRKDYGEAADEMLDSKWYREQTPQRAATLASRMRRGVYEGGVGC